MGKPPSICAVDCAGLGEAGSGRSSACISPYTTTLTTGINSRMGTYQRLSVMRLKSKERASRPRTPAMPLSRPTRSSAATIGQKAASTLTDRPGINCKSVMLPTHQNGTDNPKTSTNNVSGDLLDTGLLLPSGS